jgi:two-component sensor histidine kinase
VCLALDLTERKRMEVELRRSLAEKELLLREVHHRVKNNLQVISSLLDLQSRGIADPLSLERFQESQDRIRSMVIIHDQLHRTDDLESVDLRAYVELLVQHLADAHVDPPGRVRLRTRLDELRIDLDRALACGLIVNELVTNALKHAFPEKATGQVTVTCRARPGGQVVLEVCDDGRGFAGDPAGEVATSLGLSLVSTLTRQLRGRLSTSSQGGGASFRVEFPLGVAQEVA